MESALIAPPVLTGWMRKQGRKGLIKNWKRRYFVLKAGKVSYYAEEAKQYPLGENLKGEIHLMNTELELLEDNRKQQIYIVSFNGENNLLMETETEEETNRWSNALKQHIRYANAQSARNTQKYRSSVTEGGPTEEAVEATAKALLAENSPSEPTLSTTSVADTTSNAPSVAASNAAPSASSNNADEKAASATSKKPADPQTTTSKNTSKSASSTGATTKNTPPAKPTANPDSDTWTNPMAALNALVAQLVRLAQDGTYRTDLLMRILPTYTSAGTAFLEHLGSGGDIGSRGEELTLSALTLLGVILLGALPFLEVLLQWTLVLVAYVLLLGGLVMICSSVFELKEHCTLWLTLPYDVPPGSKDKRGKHQLVTKGVYTAVRHPMYGGLVLMAFGWALSSNVTQQAYKLILAIALSAILNRVAELEEDVLEQVYPKDYPAYAANKKALVPFIY